MRDFISIERLKKLLSYDPSTGEFTWRVYRSRGARAGWVAGSLTPDGYIEIGVDQVSYLAHRLAWFYVTGSWPKAEIDHENLCKADNRFLNLREASHTQNAANCSIRKNNKSGFKGVTFHKSTGKWRAILKTAERPLSLGLFQTPQEAHAAWSAAAIRRHGQFARLQ